jgi:hypothetical protein
VNDFNKLNIFITSKLLKQDYRYYKLRKYFTNFYNRNFDLISNFSSDSKMILNVIYKLRRIFGHCNFSVAFTKIIKRLTKRGFDPTFF